MENQSEETHKPGETIGLRIEQVAGGVESPTDGVRSVEITTEEAIQSSRSQNSLSRTAIQNDGVSDDSDDDQEPSVLQALSSDQLARRPSFKKILDDLSSSADAALHQKNNSSSDPLSAAAAATLQAHQVQAAIQQVAAAGGISNTSLLPGLFQQNLAALTTTSSAATATDQQQSLATQLSMTLPTQQQLQLQSALLNSSPGVVQSLATLPASLLSSALINANMAATLNATNTTSSGSSITSVPVVKQDQLGSTTHIIDEPTRKREVRLMKNREAARECRRKKKEYVRCLENRVAVLESQNQALIGELRALKELYLPKSQD